jgi:quercetin dioxygenase-like cupin family protein
MLATLVGMSNELKHLSWNEIKSEQMNPLLLRQFVSVANVTIARFELKKGAFVRKHQHENEQVSIILQGALKLRFEGKGEVTVRAGELVCIPPNLPHEAEAPEDVVILDVFSPPRADWAQQDDTYLR